MQLKVISVKEHTSLLVLLPSFLRCNDSYFVYFPLGFANGSSFKGALLIQDHALLV
uniref:Uncharacterized protein n=2 Tax=Candidatus Kentrum sp. FM TaxID=2126340 RepID=A0A450SHI3_9GAMM|nr:MAG: hypothetical protein BECKFM1743A_GA0114220_101051 [Candidatus Kentron sp. FM]VFK09367.1 MAG: hypothetical protein BECKFM1743B_GA0114221_101032 [Candidatus Kentron sp. FM]